MSHKVIKLWFSEWVLWAGISISWELIRDADSQALLQTYRSSVADLFQQALVVILLQAGIRTTADVQQVLLPPRNASHKSLDQHPNKGAEGCKLRGASGLRGPLILSKGSRREGGVRVGWWAPLRTNEVFSPGWWQKERPAQNRAVGQQRSGWGGTFVAEVNL